MVGWGVTERCRATERCRTVYHRIPVKPRATYNDMSERVLWIFSNLKWWTKRAQHGYIVWYFLVLLKIADVTLLHNNTAFLKNSEFATSGCKIEFLDPDGLVWPFRCWAAEGFFSKDDIYLRQWRLGWLITFEWSNFEWFGISFCWRHFPRLEVTVSFVLCHLLSTQKAICYCLLVGMPKLTQLVGGVSEDGEDWWLVAVKEWTDGSKVSDRWLSSWSRWTILPLFF